MNKEIERRPLTGTLTLPGFRAVKRSEAQEKLNNSQLLVKRDAIAQPSPAPKFKPDFNTIYKQLHAKFLAIINKNIHLCNKVSKRTNAFIIYTSRKTFSAG